MRKGLKCSAKPSPTWSWGLTQSKRAVRRLINGKQGERDLIPQSCCYSKFSKPELLTARRCPKLGQVAEVGHGAAICCARALSSFLVGELGLVSGEKVPN